jgi:site-specific recombinase XerC
MSRKTDLVSSLVAAERKASGGFDTHKSREKLLRSFADKIHKLGFVHVQKIEDVSEKHISAFIEKAKSDGLSTRTLQNYLSALRVCLRSAGKDRFADSSRISNENLGIAGASRAGTKEACPVEVLQEALSKINDDGVRAALSMMPLLGLRDEEAVRSVDSLKTWSKDLARGDVLTVIYGCKGGRAREIIVPQREKALAAVKQALSVCEKHGGKLIDRPSIDKALATLSSKAATAGLKGIHSPHSLRYAYAQDVKNLYLSRGFSEKESRSLTSISLGHGDGRGRYVERVYVQPRS